MLKVETGAQRGSMPSRTLSIPRADYETKLHIARDRIREFGYAERDGNVCYSVGARMLFHIACEPRQYQAWGIAHF